MDLELGWALNPTTETHGEKSHVKAESEIGVMGPQGYFLLERTSFNLGLTQEMLENIAPNNSSLFLVIFSGGKTTSFSLSFKVPP